MYSLLEYSCCALYLQGQFSTSFVIFNKTNSPLIAIPSGTLCMKIPIATVIPSSGDSFADAAFQKEKEKDKMKNKKQNIFRFKENWSNGAA